MNPLLVVRSEMVCLIILSFITFHSRMYKMGKDQGSFLRICIFAIGHVAFDLITVLTVNHLDTVWPWFNHLCHIVFYLFALLFAYEFFCYTVSRCYTKKVLRKVRYLGFFPLVLYFVAVPFLPMEYLAGKGTNYSFGIAAIVGYGVAMLLFLASIVVVLMHIKKLDKHIVGALLPMLCASIVAEVIQIAVPELLFTGGAITAITVGFFFSLENPVAVLRQKVLIDALTGVKSRQSYETDIVQMEGEFEKKTQFGLVYCDINDLKNVNDTGGHMEGDAYIGCVAQILMSCLKNSDAVYRMGGDEFLAVYRSPSSEVIRRELEAVDTACEQASRDRVYSVSVAMGYALSDDGYSSLKDVLRTADYQMYSHKARMKYQRAFLLNDREQVDITGLTDRIFDAFASTEPGRFLFVCNMTTNVTRWSRSAVEYLGLDSEFVYDSHNVLMERVHPDDRDYFFDDIRSILSRDRKEHEIEYRVRTFRGEYVTCCSSGTVLRGKNGEPDLFAGSMQVRASSESIDRVTELRNCNEMIACFNDLIRARTPAGLMKLSILNLSRINMLYGYDSGNEILRQFAAEVRNAVGSAGSVFRSDGTKLVVCVPHATEEELSGLYKRIRGAAEHRIQLDTITPPLQLAAGAYVLPENFPGTSSLLRSNLIFAHDRSKYEERGRLVFYDDRSAAVGSIDHKNQLLSIHQDAIAEREGFYLVYQPIVSTQTGRITGAEALLRWSGERFGVVNPGSFIPWLEEDPCFFSLGNWIIRHALTDAARVLVQQPDFVVSINIAVTQVEHEGFRHAVLELLDETGFPPNQLCLELTERCRELNASYLKEEIEFFRSHGIRVALDDLGTGFSSFALLLSLNVDEIKLDHAFIGEIRTQRVNQVLTRMLIEASKNMGYEICLEGVEDETLCSYLCEYGATYHQGYYCSNPLRIDEFLAHMETWNAVRGQKSLPAHN